MKALMDELNGCECQFIRCIKPNELKVKKLCIPKFTLQQIQYLGVLDSIKVRKESYPIRKAYASFVEIYYELWPDSMKKSFLELSQTSPDYKKISKE